MTDNVPTKKAIATITEAKRLIRNRMRDRIISEASLAKAAGVSPAAVSEFLQFEECDLIVFLKLLEACKIEIKFINN